MQKEELVISDYIGVLLRRKWFVLAITLVVTSFAYWFVSQEPVIYTSKTRIKIQRQVTFAEMLDTVLSSSGDPIQNYIHEITSFVVASNAAARLVAPATPASNLVETIRNSVSVERVAGTDLLDIMATGESGEEARRRAEAIALAFVEEHDRALQKNAQEVYTSIKESQEQIMSGLLKRQQELLSNFGPDAFTASQKDEIELLKKKLTELQLKLHELRMSGNFTEEYPEIVNTKTQIAQLEKTLNDKITQEFTRKTNLEEYERYKAIMNEISVFFSKRLEEAKIATTKKSEVVLIIEPASHGKPKGSGVMRKTFAGGLLGLMLGIVLAFVVDNLDTSVRTLVEIEGLFRLPVLGVVPHFSHHDVIDPVGKMALLNYLNNTLLVSSIRLLFRATSAAFLKSGQKARFEGKPPELIVPFSPRSPATEAYRTLRTNLQLVLKPGANSLLVTSAGPAEGKSTTIVNLAVAFAQAGQRVLLVCANMRRPQINRIFGLKRENGLSDILLGDLQWKEAIKDYQDIALGEMTGKEIVTAPGIDNLFIITCGSRTSHPAEWLSQPVTSKLLKEWQEAYDIVLIDGPPVLPVPDSVILASIVQRVLLVYQVGSTARESMRRAIAQLKNVGAELVGIVLNDVQSSWADRTDFYSYRIYYGRKEKGENV